MGPAGAVGVGEDSFSDDGGVGAVGAVEVDAFPVDELVAGVDGSKAHGVVIVDGPGVAFGNAAGAGPGASRMAMPFWAMLTSLLMGPGSI